MSTAARRSSSEYSAGGIPNLNKKEEIEVTDEDKKQASSHLYRMLFSNWMVRCGILPSLILGLTPVAGYLVFGKIIDALNAYSLYGTNPMPKVFTYTMYIVGLAVIIPILNFLDKFFWTRVGALVSTQIRKDLFNNMMRSDVTFFDVNPIGSLLTLLGEDAQLVQESFGVAKGLQLQNLGTFLSGITMSFVYSWRLALVAMAMIPVVGIIIMIAGPSIMKYSELLFKHVSNTMTITEESLAAIRTVRGFNREEAEYKRFQVETETAKKYDQRLGIIMTAMICSVMFIIWATLVGDLYYGATIVDENIKNGNFMRGIGFGPGDLFSVFGFIMLGSFGIITLQSSMQAEQKAIAAGARITKLSKYEPEVPFEGGRILDDFKGNIEFKNVSFKYPTRDAYVLKNVSFKISAGQIGALVGHSGSGKSTCVQLLERYYDISEGQILLDDVDIRELDPRWLHRQISLVAQEPVLFQMTIKENITYGVDNATDEMIQYAIESANCKKFIDKLPNGLEEKVGEKGSSLSGGQRQRIAIARAIIKKPKILITDEATSALDAGSEKKVQMALDNIMKGLTAVVVAHRLSTIRNADIIYVFDAGEIKETGTHNELVEAKGVYYNLVKRQLSKEES